MRQTQQRLLVAPLLGQLRRRYPAREALEQRLLAQLSRLRERADYAQGYGPANLLALLRLLRGHLRGLDLSQLVLRGVDLQGVQMQDATLAGALLRESFLTEAFDAIFAVAISRSGQYWAAAERRGRSADVARARPDLASGLAGAHGYRHVSRFQSGRTHAGQREPWMAASSCGTSRVERALVEVAQARSPSAWPLPPMDACWQVGGVMRRSGSGIRSWAPSWRRCRIPARSPRWPGVRMGTCSPVATSRARSGCGRSAAEPASDGVSRASKAIAVGCGDWPLRPTATAWPARAGMAASSCGNWKSGQPSLAPDARGAYRQVQTRGVEPGWRHAGQWQLGSYDPAVGWPGGHTAGGALGP